jgi:hypothetical protein
MPKYAGKNALIYVGGVNMSGQANEWSLNVGASSNDADVFGESWDSKVQGTPNWSGQISGLAAHEGGAVGTLVADKLFQFIDNGGDKAMLIYPVGGGSLKPYWYGTGFLSGLPLTGSRKGMYGFQASIMGGENGQLLNLKTA